VQSVQIGVKPFRFAPSKSAITHRRQETHIDTAIPGIYGLELENVSYLAFHRSKLSNRRDKDKQPWQL